jgi:hypothetical protein
MAQVAHDLRGLVAAATISIEYLRDLEGMPTEAVGVAVEIESELRLAAEVIGLLDDNRDPARVAPIDLRALFWLATHEGSPILMTATQPPFVLRGPVDSLRELVSSLAAVAREGCTLRVDDGALRLEGFGADEARKVVRAGSSCDVDLVAHGDTLLLRRRDSY